MESFIIHGKYIETSNRRAWFDVTKIGAFFLEKSSSSEFSIQGVCDGDVQIFAEFDTEEEARDAIALMLISVSGRPSASLVRESNRAQGLIASLKPAQ